MKVLQNHRSPTKASPKKRQPSGSAHASSVPPAKRPKIQLVDDSAADSSSRKASAAALPWVEKYKPTSLKQLIGQQTDKSPANKLLDWLRNWARYHLTPQVPGEKKKGWKLESFFF
jgi:replication factor C subunit 1